ncbi:deoxynucleoside triphosphate triphosphohydrolase SAMHD1-like [Pomacea canaliculata]|uniref:deoxynucleoside triphosphate triphosphohydrolase SAMHD1-like n=1 Tax=Pomacea canaliculata TaxID=400727 RepID=UPI000D72FFB8|nr:deoxynucleoside triphosphate triphosphohydrolase SAMHD1-like [Pomacea canaliculata]
MFVEILMLAEKVPLIPGERGQLKTVSRCIDDMTAYTNLTDYIFHQIRISTGDNLKKARDLLQALDERRLFWCVGESRPIAKCKCEILNEDNLIALDKEEKVKKSLMKLIEDLKFPHIPEERILVQVVTLDFGKKNLNPLANLCFYTKHNVNLAQHVNPEEVSHLFPKEQFQEQVVRVYLKHYWDEEERLIVDHKEDASFVGKAFKLWCEKNELEKPKLFFQVCQVRSRGGMNITAAPLYLT